MTPEARAEAELQRIIEESRREEEQRALSQGLEAPVAKPAPGHAQSDDQPAAAAMDGTDQIDAVAAGKGRPGPGSRVNGEQQQQQTPQEAMQATRARGEEAIGGCVVPVKATNGGDGGSSSRKRQRAINLLPASGDVKAPHDTKDATQERSAIGADANVSGAPSPPTRPRSVKAVGKTQAQQQAPRDSAEAVVDDGEEEPADHATDTSRATRGKNAASTPSRAAGGKRTARGKDHVVDEGQQDGQEVASDHSDVEEVLPATQSAGKRGKPQAEGSGGKRRRLRKANDAGAD